MLVFKHNAGGFGTLGTLALEAETSGESNITAHRYRRSCIPIPQMFEQMPYQEPLHFVYPDPSAQVLDEADPHPRIATAVGDLELANLV